MTELRLHAIGLYAGFDVSVPEPLSTDGTTEGLVADVDSNYGTSIDQIIVGLISEIVPEWILENFWPVLYISLGLAVEVVYDILVVVDLIGNSEVRKMDIECLAANDYSDEELSIAFDLSFENIFLAIVEAGKWLYPFLLQIGLDILRNSSYDTTKFLILCAAWLLSFFGYMVFVFWTFDNGYSNAWECFGMMCELLLLLLIGSSLLLDVSESFRLFDLVLDNPLLTGSALLGKNFNDVLQDQKLGWKFPVIFIEFIALIITSYFLGYWFMVALIG